MATVNLHFGGTWAVSPDKGLLVSKLFLAGLRRRLLLQPTNQFRDQTLNLREWIRQSRHETSRCGNARSDQPDHCHLFGSCEVPMSLNQQMKTRQTVNTTDPQLHTSLIGAPALHLPTPSTTPTTTFTDASCSEASDGTPRRLHSCQTLLRLRKLGFPASNDVVNSVTSAFFKSLLSCARRSSAKPLAHCEFHSL